jgi:hypothetical protein
VRDVVAVFDLGPGSTGAYYVTGEYVWHDGQVCLVTATTRIAGTRFRASLRVVAHPTPQQRRAAQDWRARMGL